MLIFHDLETASNKCIGLGPRFDWLFHMRAQYRLFVRCLRKLTPITDNGKTTTELMALFYCFFQLQLRKNNGRRLGTLQFFTSHCLIHYFIHGRFFLNEMKSF
jgi:hypothetical protein